jgi:hypothetical protein
MAETGSAPRPAGSRIYRRLLRQARDYWPHNGCLFLLGLIAAPLALLTPLPLKIAVDNVIGDEPAPGWLGFLPDSVTDSKSGLLAVVTVLVVLIALASQLVAFEAVLNYSTEKDVKLLKLLIKRGFDVNCQNEFGQTPLMLAVCVL